MEAAGQGSGIRLGVIWRDWPRGEGSGAASSTLPPLLGVVSRPKKGQGN